MSRSLWDLLNTGHRLEAAALVLEVIIVFPAAIASSVPLPLHVAHWPTAALVVATVITTASSLMHMLLLWVLLLMWWLIIEPRLSIELIIDVKALQRVFSEMRTRVVWLWLLHTEISHVN